MKIVFDIETNGLDINKTDKIHILVGKDYETKETTVFSPDDLPLKEIPDYLNQADVLIGHNIIQYDIPILRKFFHDLKFKWHSVGEPYTYLDTMIFSQVLKFHRFKAKPGLKSWGDFLKFPKFEHNEWDVYSADMRERCVSDVELNSRVYSFLLDELNNEPQNRRKVLKKVLQTELAVSEFCARATERGWAFDKQKAEEFVKKSQKRLQELKNLIEPKMPKKLVEIDKQPKKVQINKDGRYSQTMCRIHGVSPDDAFLPNPPLGSTYQRVKYEPRMLSSDKDVKAYLKTIGWEPDEFNVSYTVDKRGKKTPKFSPKISETSLLKLGQIGKDILEFNSLSSKESVVRKWLNEHLTEDNRIHGESYTIGTPTFRMRHSVIVNVPAPSEKNEYGDIIRSMFTTSSPNNCIVGTDSKGNQTRGLLHLLRNDELTREVLDGDIHAVNAEKLQKAIPEFDGSRKKCKSMYYGILFGAGGEKVFEICFGDYDDNRINKVLFGTSDMEKLNLRFGDTFSKEKTKRRKKVGLKIKNQFLNVIGGFKKLLESLENHIKYDEAGKKFYTRSRFDYRIITMKNKHTSLNYQLQAGEKNTMTGAIYKTIEKLTKANLDWEPLIFNHDEIQIECRKKDSLEIQKICLEAFSEGPKMFGVQIMEGDSSIGQNWAETH